MFRDGCRRVFYIEERGRARILGNLGNFGKLRQTYELSPSVAELFFSPCEILSRLTYIWIPEPKEDGLSKRMIVCLSMVLSKLAQNLPKARTDKEFVAILDCIYTILHEKVINPYYSSRKYLLKIGHRRGQCLNTISTKPSPL